MPTEKKSGLASSLLFINPEKEQKSGQAVARSGGHPVNRPSGQSARRSDGRTVASPAKRVKKRQGANFYVDQLVSLKEIQLNYQKHGQKEPSLSEMIIDAIDNYIAMKKRELEIE